MLKNNMLQSKIYVTNLFGKASIILLIIAFYFYLILESAYGFKNGRILFLVLGYISFSLGVAFVAKIKMDNKLFLYYMSSLFFYLISFLFWEDRLDLNVYLSTFSAIICINEYKFFIKVMTWLIIITCVLALIEFVSKTYLFVVVRNTVFGLRPLDEKFFGGLSQIFRAKVFFEGPLALSQFSIGLAFLFRYRLKILFLILIIAILANGRLGILVCSIFIILYFIKKYNLINLILKPKNLLVIIITLILVILLGYSLMSEASINRLLDALSLDNDGNSARISYWINGFKTWLNYDFIHIVFGNNGYFNRIHRNNAENGWVTLLINNGLIGFLYYTIPVFLIILQSFQNRLKDLDYVLILCTCMFVQTFHLGASANLFYWLIIYSLIKSKECLKNI